MSETQTLKHLIGGEWVGGNAGIESLNPSDTRDVVARAPNDDGTAMRAAVACGGRGVSGLVGRNARKCAPTCWTAPAR